MTTLYPSRRGLSRRAALLGVGGSLVSLAGCASEVDATQRLGVASAPSGSTGPLRSFRFVTLDRRVASTDSYRGRMSLVVLAATYDAASQVQARFVNAVYLKHRPRINALLLVLEPTQHEVLVDAFRQSLGLRYDVAIADPETIAGRGPFPGLHHVPSVVMLDREGHEVWRNLGVVEEHQLHEALDAND
ncbi:MAG: TlpA family protein disulfide reductase [Myxococcales bacterium]|nr:TlpA family protein disulfide reductase [Myxococcales bacterium]